MTFPAAKRGGAPTRVGAALNQALHERLASDDRLFLLGEDIADPYGGAFGITRGLSGRFPDRVWSTPISEQAIVGAAGGLALCGNRVLVEVMFGDFITLCVDPLVNFLSKSVSMYGRHIPVPVVVRTPVGGNRGYGPTHSQHPMKLLFGTPHLALYELSPVHDPVVVLARALDAGEPAVLFEDKVLYTTPAYRDGRVDELFRFALVDEDWALVYVDEAAPDWVVIAPGGLVPRVLDAMRMALRTVEVGTHLLVPSRLYPVDLTAVLPLLATGARILLVEDGVAGGGWSAELARLLYERLWGRLREPIRVLQPPCAVIPAAPHLERQVLVQAETIARVLSGDGGG